MIFRKSISAKFIFAVFIVLLVGQCIGTVIIFFHTKNVLLDSLRQRILASAHMAAGVISGPLLNDDHAAIETYLDEMAKDEGITSIHILDKHGIVVWEDIKTGDATEKKLNPLLNREGMSTKVPVISGGEKLGDVVIDYSAQSINESLSRNMTMIGLYQLIVIVCVGVLMLALFNINIKNPVSDINSAIKKITMGDLSSEVPDFGENEIGSIAKGISFLVERLSTTIYKLSSTATNVMMAIKQVDVLYQNVMEGITKQSESVKEIIKAVQYANKSQSEIISNTEKLSSFSTENVSSLLEMKATAEEIAANTQRLFKATEDSYAVVVDMTQASKSIENNAQEIVSALEDTSASVEEVWASIKEVEEHARDSSRLAETVKEITSDRGMLEVVNAVEGMDRISDEVKRSSEIIQRLGTRSDDIEKVLSVIKDVTEQTNLLSLNAAILAAQAGEYGKSFSVVADEISALSERTASSTREIAGIVKTIQRDIKNAVRSIDTAKNKVEDGNSLVLKVGDALKEILTASEHSTDMTKAIQRATEEQSIGLRQITSAVEEIRKMMNSVAHSTSEQDKALGHLLEGVGEVKEVADFSKRGTEEEAAGTRTISKNLGLANERISQINRAGVKQKELNDDIIASIDQINSLGLSTVRDMEEVSHSLKTLFEEIEFLKKEMEIFKIK